jgi:cell wall assembly regulator SMI1
MDNSILTVWRNLIIEFNKANPSESAIFNTGATNLDLIEFEKIAGIPFPSELKTIYELNNGQIKGRGIFFGLQMLQIDEKVGANATSIIAQWKIWKEVYDDEVSGNLVYTPEMKKDWFRSYPDKAIKLEYVNPKWIPFAYDLTGNHHGIDLDPDINGKVGQVINFGRDEEEKIVIANSFKEYLQLCLNLYKDGTYKEIGDMYLTDYLIKKVKNKSV